MRSAARCWPTACSASASTSRPSTGPAAVTCWRKSWRPSVLIALIFALARSHRGAIAAPTVGAYIGAAYWFTSSTSFANPAVAIGRMFSDTFAGIAPGSVPGFILMEVIGLVVGLAVVLILVSGRRRRAPPRRWCRMTPRPQAITLIKLSRLTQKETADMHLAIIGGSDAGISAALRARELDPSVDVTVIVADAYPNFSICGIPYYISGEVTHWRNLAHRTHADLEATGMRAAPRHTGHQIEVAGQRVIVRDEHGPSRPSTTTSWSWAPAPCPCAHRSKAWTTSATTTVSIYCTRWATPSPSPQPRHRPAQAALIVGAGYVGLEMAEGLTTRGIHVTQVEMLPEVFPTVDVELARSCAPNCPSTASTCTPQRRSPASAAPRAARPG